MGKEQDLEIRIESWKQPGRLDMIIGSNGTAQVFSVRLSGGPDPALGTLDNSLFPLIRELVDQHEADLLRLDEPVGMRRLRLCEYTKEELAKLMNQPIKP